MPAFISGGKLISTITATIGREDDRFATEYLPLGSDFVLSGGLTPQEIWDSQPSVRKVVDFIARQVAATPLKAYRRIAANNRAPLPHDHPLATWTFQPDPGLRTAYRFWHTLVTDFLLWDRWAAIKTARGDVDAGATTLIPSGRFHIDGDGLRHATAITVDGLYSVPPAQAVFDAGWNVTAANGSSIIRTLAAVLEESRLSIELRKAMWKNAGAAPAYISRPRPPTGEKDWSKEAKARFIEQMRSYKASGALAGGWPLFEDGMELRTVEMFSADQNRICEYRQLTDAEVASAFHIQPELVGAREGNYGSVDAFRAMLYGPTLGPTYAQLSQIINACLVPELSAPGESLYVEFDRDAMMKGSFIEQAQVNQSAAGAPFMTRNEVRSRSNLPPVDGGDELVVPLNVITGGLASPRDTAPDPLALSARSGAKAASKPDGLGTLAQERAAFQDAIAAFFTKQAKELGGKADGFDVGAFTDTWDTPLAKIATGHMLRLAQVGAWNVLARWNPTGDGWSADVMEPWIHAAGTSVAHAINTGTANRLSSRGDTSVKDVFANLITEHAATFAATFATQAFSFGQHDAAKASGLGSKTWNTTSGNPRPSHAAMDGESVAINDAFSNGAQWPGDPSLDVDEIAGCTCGVTFTT